MATQTVRWLHLSDFHVGMDDYAQRRIFEYVHAHVGKRKVDGFVPDLIFITGDLADKGKDSEYEAFWLEFVSPLQEIIGSGIRDRTFVVPGNHDVDRKQNPHFDRGEMAAAKSHCFDANAEGQALRQMLMPRFKAFAANDCTVVSGAFGTEAGSFAKTVTIRGFNVGIAGINTSWLCKDDDDERKLSPGKGLLEYSLKQLRDTRLRIVLGHHPLEWLNPSEQKPIKSLLGKHGALYLHGHLHDAWAEPNYGGGHHFLAVQAGAGFQAREGEKWRNGLLWGEVELVTEQLRLQPWRWIAEQQNWAIAADVFPEEQRDGEWWTYPLPGTAGAIQLSPSRGPHATPPKGWSITTAEELRGYVKPLDGESAIRFFDGAVPGWQMALSSSIPRRNVVSRLAARFVDVAAAPRPIVALLLAAACEGKTTALLQAAHEIVSHDPTWRILRRVDDAEPMKPAEILPLLSKSHCWLIIVDEADRVADSMFNFLRQLPSQLAGRVHFLIACRDSDWQASQAYNHNWSSTCSFRQEQLVGLDERDAESIVAAWAKFGQVGLGDLAQTSEAERAGLLIEQAREEAKTKHGAFFGALLAVRHGSDLPNHVRLMLERLSHREIPSGGNLRDALAFIAAMHAEGLEYLCRGVLAQALGCPIARLHRDVLAPLGQEAAATTTSSFIFTRHGRIAEAIVSVLHKDFAEDVSESFVVLAKAAMEATSEGQFLSVNLSQWRFRCADHFLQTGRPDLALRVARSVLSCEPLASKTIVHVASIYRKVGAPEKGVELFRQIPALAKMERSFYYEWANAEGACDDHAASTLLAAYSLSDDCIAPRVDNNSAKKILAGLGLSFGKLFEAHRDVDFRDARAAVAVLGQQLNLDPTAESYFRKHLFEAMEEGASTPNVESAFGRFRAGVIAAEDVQEDHAFTEIVPDAGSLDFGGFRHLIYASIEARDTSLRSGFATSDERKWR